MNRPLYLDHLDTLPPTELRFCSRSSSYRAISAVRRYTMLTVLTARFSYGMPVCGPQGPLENDSSDCSVDKKDGFDPSWNVLQCLHYHIYRAICGNVKCKVFTPDRDIFDISAGCRLFYRYLRSL